MVVKPANNITLLARADEVIE